MGIDAAALDRLPWLADEPSRTATKGRRRRSLLPLAAAVVALVGIAGFWFGISSVDQPLIPIVRHAPTAMTIALPPARPAISPQVALPAGKDVAAARVTDVRPAPAREVRIAPPIHLKALRPEVTTAVRGPKARAPDSHGVEGSVARAAPFKRSAVSAGAQPSAIPRPWNPRMFAGAAGRLVQVGAFGSVAQAKHGWWFMVRAYPAMAHLPAVVRPSSNSKGSVFYRFQVGTTSQAHSEVVCQRMEKIALSCAVIGLPWKAKIER